MLTIYMSCAFLIQTGDEMGAGFWKYPIFFLLWFIGWHLFEMGFWYSQQEMIEIMLKRKRKLKSIKMQKAKGQWDK